MFVTALPTVIYRLIQSYAPTNVLLRRLRTRRGLRWSIPMMLLGVLYLWIAAICSILVQQGGPGWLHLIVALCIWNGLKFLLAGPVLLIRLIRTRWIEYRGRHRTPAVTPAVRDSSIVPDLTWVRPISMRERACSGRNDHIPDPECFTHGRCQAALGFREHSI